jgi:selenocysteine lyase/cysteine desulfurase
MPMSSLNKIETDYNSYIKIVEEKAAASKAKIRQDLNALREKAAQFSSTP